MAERPRRRRDDNEDDDRRRKPGSGSGRPPARRSDPSSARGAERSRSRAPQGRDGRPRRDKDDGKPRKGRPPQARDGRAGRTQDRRPAQPAKKRSARVNRDDESPTRSGIQYPPRRTARRDAEPRPDPALKRPVLRKVKGAGGSPAKEKRKRAPAKTAKPGKTSTRAVPRRRRRSTEAADELARVAGRNARSAQDQLARAAEAYAAGRERDAARLLRPLRDAYPDVAAVRELLGLVQYRLGNYPAATKELIAFADLSRSVEQHPVLMDCWRAQRRFDKVEELWTELAQSSPSGALVTEGRIVLAGAYADAGRLQLAIETLARRGDDVKRVEEFHLRLWYALGGPVRAGGRDTESARVLRPGERARLVVRGRCGTVGRARLSVVVTPASYAALNSPSCRFPDGVSRSGSVVSFDLPRRARGSDIGRKHVRQSGRRPRHLFEPGRGP